VTPFFCRGFFFKPLTQTLWFLRRRENFCPPSELPRTGPFQDEELHEFSLPRNPFPQGSTPAAPRLHPRHRLKTFGLLSFEPPNRLLASPLPTSVSCPGATLFSPHPDFYTGSFFGIFSAPLAKPPSCSGASIPWIFPAYASLAQGPYCRYSRSFPSPTAFFDAQTRMSPTIFPLYPSRDEAIFPATQVFLFYRHTSSETLHTLGLLF